MDKHLNYDDHHYESKTRTHRLSKLTDDGDPYVPNNILKSGAKEKTPVEPPQWASNRQEAPAPTKLMNSFKSVSRANMARVIF